MGVNTGINTQGTDFRISDDGISYITLGCVESWTQDAPARAEIDTTCLMDTVKSYKFGLQDSGTLSVDTIYAPDGAGQALLEASYASNDPYYFEVEYSDTAGVTGTIKTFQGYVVSYNESGSKDDVVRLSLSIKISGEITQEAPTAV